MYFSFYLLVTLVCVMPVSATECPDNCECKEYKLYRSIHRGFKVHCAHGLKHLPRDYISSDVIELDLSSNQIKVLSDVEENVKNMTEIKRLVFHENDLMKIEVNSLRGFYSLERLDLSHNNISDIPVDLFKTMPQLTHLYLVDNRYLILPEKGFGTKELEVLFIGYCNLKDVPFKFFDTMPNIKYLYLAGNQISYLSTYLTSHIKNMEYVFLENNNLTVFQPEIITLLTESSVVFYLNHNPFSCDCEFSHGSELYTIAHTTNDAEDWMNSDLNCEIPAESKEKYIDQIEYLNSIDCNVSTSENTTVQPEASTPSGSYTNEEYYKEHFDEITWYTSHTALWIVLGGVVVIVLFVVGVKIERRRRRNRRRLELSEESQPFDGLGLQRDLEAVADNFL